MKKLLFFLFALLVLSDSEAQTADTLLRSSGLFISPSLTGLYNTLDTASNSPRFGISAGYRFVNKMKYGLFIESGVNYSWLSAKYPSETFHITAYDRPWIYSENANANQMFLSVPFLLGYKTTKGKVRFEASAGFSINLKFSDYKIVTTSGQNPYSVTPKSKKGDVLDFGTGMSAILKAGISVPLTKRLSLDILPAMRWQFLSFKGGSMDILKSADLNNRKWSAGLDVGLMWALDNAATEVINEKKPVKTEDFTFQYIPGEEQPLNKPKTKPWGYKNYLYLEIAGNALVYSINYERDVYDRGVLSVLVRGGLGMFGERYAIPVGGSILAGKGTKKFEAGIYSTFEDIMFHEFNINIVPALAFRWVSQDHFFIRASVMSHIVVSTGEIMPGVGLSIGGGF
jgi:hypothetical protein